MNTNRLSPKLLAGIIVALFFGVALWLRIYLPYEPVFGGEWIKFTSIDAYYHMRLVDNLVHNFPHLISFDPYLRYPIIEISRIHFFDWLLAGIIWVVGLGSPTQHTIDVVGAYFPAVLGSLTVIPVYFIGKELFNRWAGVISAGLIAFIPGESIGRSMLGFTDHDVAGTLFSTVTILFLILAIKAARQRGLTFNHFKQRNWATITKPVIYSLLAGISLGIYLLTWEYALLFVFTIFAYFIIQFIIDHLKHRTTDYLCLVSVIFFLTSLLILLPASPNKLSLASLVIALLIPPVLSGISRLLTSRQIKPGYYPLTVVGLGLAGFFIFRAFNPALFTSMMHRISIVFPTGTRLATLEMQPLLFLKGNFTTEIAWGNFTTGFFLVPPDWWLHNSPIPGLSLIALVILIYLVIKRGNAEKGLLLVWSLVILVITLAQRRFASYFAVNVALLTGYLSILIFFVIRSIIAYLRNEPTKYLSEQILESPDVGKLLTTPTAITPKRIERKKAKLEKRYQGGFDTTTRYINMALAGLIVFFLAFFPNIKPAIDTAKHPQFAPPDAWCQSLSWLKANTSDPFGDPGFYHEFYEPSSSPTPAYTILAWWDYGYWITRIAHRVPNVNPAQSGVYDVACFFLSQDEDSANEIRQGLGSTFIITDYETAIIAYAIVSGRLRVHTKFWAIATWAERDPTEFYDIYYLPQEGKMAAIVLFYPEYYRSLSTRLYNFDGKAVTPQSSLVISYQKRVVQKGQEPIKVITEAKSFPSYEEAVAYISSQKSTNYKIVGDDPFISPVPLEELKHYQPVYSSESLIMHSGGRMVPSVKIFEYVEAE